MRPASLVLAASAALSAVASAVPAPTQFVKPEDAIKYRQSAMFVLAQHFGRIGAMVSGKAPYDPQAALANAQFVATIALQPWQAFGPGTDHGRDTRAKPEVWADQARFREAQDRLLGELPKLVEAAKSNDVETLKTAFQGTAGACKNCHDHFRKD